MLTEQNNSQQWVNEYIRASSQRAKSRATGRGDHEQPRGRGRTRSELRWEAADMAELAAWLLYAAGAEKELNPEPRCVIAWRKKSLGWGKGKRRWQGSHLGETQERFKSRERVVLRSALCYGVRVVGTAQAAEQHCVISDMERHK